MTDNNESPATASEATPVTREPLANGAAEGAQVTEQAPKQPQTQEFAIPDEYKDKGWVSKVNNLDDLFKQMDNTDTLVGKKTIGVPDWENATPEDISDYYSKVRPEKVDDYSFEGDFNEGEKEAIQKIMHDNGISAYQAKGIVENYRAIQQEQMQAQFTQEGAEKALGEALGEGWKTAYSKNNEVIKATGDKDFMGFIDSLPNSQLAAFHRGFANFAKNYGVSESDANVNGTASAHKVDKKSLQSEIRQKLADISKRPHTDEEKQVLLKQLDESYR